MTRLTDRLGYLPKECRNGEVCLAVFGVMFE